MTFSHSPGPGVTLSGSPAVGGSNTQVQYNNAGALAGAAGVTTDGTTLTVSGSSASTMLRVTQTGAGNALLVEDSANPDATPFVVTAAGDVGIGTTAPAVKFDMTSTGLMARFNSPTTTSAYIRCDDSSAATNIFGILGGNAWVGSGSSTPLVLITNSTEKMRIDTSGNVGIGTSAPTFRVQVALASTTDNLAIGVTETTYATNFRSVYINYFGTSATGTTYGISNANLGALRFQNVDRALIGINGSGPLIFATTSLERMRIDASGNVGIGTTSPTAGVKLDVIDSGDTAFNVGSTGTIQSARVRIVARQTSVDDEWNIVATGAGLGSSALRFVKGTWTNTPAAVITSAGLVGIGTTSPTALLDVQSTTAGVRFPNMTTAQKNAIATPQAGTMVFDTTLAKLCVYSGAAWETITSV